MRRYDEFSFEHIECVGMSLEGTSEWGCSVRSWIYKYT